MLRLFLCLAALFGSSLPLSLSEYVDETMTLLISDGGKVHVELLGTREGTPVLIVHGGWGPWPVKNMAQSIDLEKHFVVYPHHRGWGLSGPTVESGITERHAKDFEEVREALGLSKWKIMAGSNGATLALAYASLFPDRVHFLVLRASWAVRYKEVFYNYGDFEMGKALHYPDEWDKLAGHVGCGRTKETKCVGLELLRRYERKLLKSSEEEAEETATHFLKWDAYGNSVSPPEDTGKLSLPWPLKEVALSGIQWYLDQAINEESSVAGEKLIGTIEKNMKDIKVTFVSGQYDMICPPLFARDITEKIPLADVHFLSGAAHNGGDPGFAPVVTPAINAEVSEGTLSETRSVDSAPVRDAEGLDEITPAPAQVTEGRDQIKEPVLLA